MLDKQVSELIKKASGSPLKFEDTKIVAKVFEDIRKNFAVNWCSVNKLLKDTDFQPEKLISFKN